jgi:alpha-tubulin suppressor-like RCC1 family protein
MLLCRNLAAGLTLRHHQIWHILQLSSIPCTPQHDHHLLPQDGSVISWGDDLYGQVKGTPTAEALAAGGGAIAVAAGGSHSLALLRNGSVLAWWVLCLPACLARLADRFWSELQAVQVLAFWQGVMAPIVVQPWESRHAGQLAPHVMREAQGRQRGRAINRANGAPEWHSLCSSDCGRLLPQPCTD